MLARHPYNRHNPQEYQQLFAQTCQLGMMLWMQAIGTCLDAEDGDSATLVNKHWRQVLLPAVLQELTTVVAHHLDPQAATGVGSSSTWRNLATVLRHAAPGLKLTLLIGERMLPTPGQMEAVAQAIKQHGRNLRLQLDMSELINGPLKAIDSKRLSAILTSFFAGLATTEPTLCELDVSVELLQPQHIRDFFRCLAQLRSLQQLSYRSKCFHPNHLSPIITALTNLTSLSLSWSLSNKDMHQAQEVLQQLAPLSKLVSLRLEEELKHVSLWCVRLVPVPAWPHLRQLHLASPVPCCLQLSAQHCKQLQSLTAHRFLAPAPGVTSMDSLTRLQMTQPPAAPAAPGGTPEPSLLLPALKELTVGDNTPARDPELDLTCDLLTALRLAQQAPDLEALDVARATPSYCSATPAVLQHLAQLGRRVRRLRLPKVAQPWMDDAQQVDAALLQLLSQHCCSCSRSTASCSSWVSS